MRQLDWTKQLDFHDTFASLTTDNELVSDYIKRIIKNLKALKASKDATIRNVWDYDCSHLLITSFKDPSPEQVKSEALKETFNKDIAKKNLEKEAEKLGLSIIWKDNDKS